MKASASIWLINYDSYTLRDPNPEKDQSHKVFIETLEQVRETLRIGFEQPQLPYRNYEEYAAQAKPIPNLFNSLPDIEEEFYEALGVAQTTQTSLTPLQKKPAQSNNPSSEQKPQRTKQQRQRNLHFVHFCIPSSFWRSMLGMFGRRSDTTRLTLVRQLSLPP